MIVDGRSVAAGERITTDVCVVGSGPAGLTVARELSRRGVCVAVLEAGGVEARREEPGEESAVSVGIPYDIRDSRAYGFGGTSTTWRVDTYAGGHHVRLRALDPGDFATREWVAHSGWPLTSSQMEQPYRRARAIFGLPEHQQAALDRSHPQDNALGAGDGRVQARAFEFSPRSVFTVQARRECERDKRVTVVVHARAVDIRTDDAPGQVSSIRVCSAPGRHFSVSARCYVLAAGGIESPRLLLASTSRHAHGIGNGHGLVGRFFMDHPHFAAGLLHPTGTDLFRAQASYVLHDRAGTPTQWKYGPSDANARANRLLGYVVALKPMPWTPALVALREGRFRDAGFRSAIELREAARHRRLPERPAALIGRVAAGLPELTRHAAVSAALAARRRWSPQRAALPRVFKLEAMAEQAPNPDSRVRLGRGRDRFGVPKVELDWRLTSADLDSMYRAQSVLASALQENGVGRVHSFLDGANLPPGLNSGPHHMGTTRMHPDPGQGVVDRHCRVHGVDNLYVAGSSLFPTGGYANPTLTVVALAVRLSDHLLARLRERAEICR